MVLLVYNRRMIDSVFNSALRSSAIKQKVVFDRIADIIFVTFKGEKITRHASFRTLKNDIKVHSSFWSQFKSVEEVITQKIEENPDARVILFTGHSVGGALAQIAAAYYGTIYTGRFRFVCHTFGSPRVGNKHFVKWFSDHVDENVRVQNEKDPIPMFPLGTEWVHTFDMAWSLSADMTGRIKHHDTRWYLKRLITFLKSDPDEHACKVYIERLES